jgi:hypothetical protein
MLIVNQLLINMVSAAIVYQIQIFKVLRIKLVRLGVGI